MRSHHHAAAGLEDAVLRLVALLPPWTPEAGAKASIVIRNIAIAVLLRLALHLLQLLVSWIACAVVQEVARGLDLKAESVQVYQLLQLD
jgi:hypothetical protein